MRTSHFYTAIFSIILFSVNSNAMGEEGKNSKEAEWDFYLQSIDPYADDSDKTTPAAPESNRNRPARTIIKPKPLPNGATSKQISEYNQNMQKALRKQQEREAATLYETVESMGYQPAQKPPEAPEKPFTIATPNSIVNSGYSAKKLSFNWGGKTSGYEYVDYEFVFESTNTEHTEKMTTAMNKIAKSGWEVDLNRSFQRVEGNGDNTKAFTTTQMRFRRRQ